MADQRPLKIAITGQLQRFQTDDTVPIYHGGTGGKTAAEARSNLGLALGSDAQPFDSDLAAIAALTSTGIPVRVANDTWSLVTIASASISRITVSNGNGVIGNPTIDLATLADGGGGGFYKFTRDAYGRVSGTTAVVAGDLTNLLDNIYAPIASPTFTGTVTLPGDPNSALQATTKQYVDNLFASGGIAPFSSVKLKTTANHGLSSLSAIDGVTPVAGDRILVASQSTASQNGVYVAAAGGWTRATDADQSAEFQPARQVFVQQGATFANTGWAVSSAANPTVGTDPISFTQVSGAASYVAGNGLSLTGNTFAVVGTAGRVTVSGSGVDLASGVVTAGTYTKLTVDTYGRVTTGATATPGDIGAQPADATLTALASYNTNGLLTQTAADTFTGRTLTGTAGRVTVSNGNGVSGNPTIDLATSGVSAGTYTSVTVDTYGRVTSGSTASAATVTDTAQNGEASAIAICRAVYSSGADAVKLANANSSATTNVVGLVSALSIASSATGAIAFAGVLTATAVQWDAVTGQSGGLTPGATYFLSNTTNGALTTTAPTSGHVVPVGIAFGTTRMRLGFGPVVAL